MAGQGGRSRRASCSGADWLTGRPPHGGWAREICCDELWILLYVRTVTVTFSFGIGLRYLSGEATQTQTPAATRADIAQLANSDRPQQPEWLDLVWLD